MFFFPYRMDSEKSGLPIFTVLICLLCIFIYWQQYSVDKRYYQAIEQFCLQDLSRREVGWLERLPTVGRGNQCALLLESIRGTPDSAAEIKRLSALATPVRLFASKADNVAYIEKQIDEIYQKFEASVPHNLTNDLAYDPHDLDAVKMVTSTFSHGSVMHLLGNLLFFYIFAASVELIIGSLRFGLFVITTTFGTSLAYSYAMYNVEGALPTVGLSGVVMAAIAALGLMMPAARIRCFFWFLIFFKTFRIPALFIAIWYVGWDIYEMNQLGNDSYINYVAHISGAFIGAMIAIYFVVFRKKLLNEAAVHY